MVALILYFFCPHHLAHRLFEAKEAAVNQGAVNGLAGVNFFQKSRRRASLDAAAVKAPAGKAAPKEKLEWYGFVRLVVFARPDSVLGALLCPPNACVTGVVPAGSKVAGSPTAPANGGGGGGAPPGRSPPPPYAANRSPDKGAVCAYFPAAQLLVAAAHLHGTSKAGVPEAVYDAVSNQQGFNPRVGLKNSNP